MQYLFYDPVCPKAYNSDTLKAEPMGGTEATVIRVADSLGATVEQHNRSAPDGRYMPAGTIEKTKAAVGLRLVRPMAELRDRFPNAKLVLWLHDLATQDLVDNAYILEDLKPTIVCVSDFHVSNVVEKLKIAGYPKGVQVRRIYNPIADDLQRDATAVDHTKLVFFSSPHKGLNTALTLFQYVRNMAPEMRLYVANPGYYAHSGQLPEGVIDVGSLPHTEVLKHVREALCVFYPNNVFPETFGLVFAEANAVGTPVLTASIGAAREVLDHIPAQFCDPRNYKGFVDRVLAWRSARPIVRGQEQFRLSRVVHQWKQLLKS